MLSYRPTHLLTVSYDVLGQLKILSFINNLCYIVVKQLLMRKVNRHNSKIRNIWVKTHPVRSVFVKRFAHFILKDEHFRTLNFLLATSFLDQFCLQSFTIFRMCYRQNWSWEHLVSKILCKMDVHNYKS